jgi:uncharacterized protein DUF4913
MNTGGTSPDRGTSGEVDEELAEEITGEITGEIAGEIARLGRRVGAVEADLFTLTEQVRHAALAAQRAASGLDELEDVLAGLDERAAAATPRAVEWMEQAMRQRQLALDADPAARQHGRADGIDGGDNRIGPGGEVRDAAGGQRPTVELPPLHVVHAFVEQHIAPLVRKTTTTGEGGGIRWCREWWRHIDAVQRFTALHIVWTDLSHQDDHTWLSGYYRDHLDPHLATLTSPFGPFHTCTPMRHSDVIEPLGQTPLRRPPSPDHARPGPALSERATDVAPTAAGSGAGAGGVGGVGVHAHADGSQGSGGGPGVADGSRAAARDAPATGHTAGHPGTAAWPTGGQTGRRQR